MIDFLRNKIARCDTARQLVEAVVAGTPRVRVGHLVGSLKSLVMAEVFDRLEAPLVVVTPDEVRAQWLYSDLQALLGPAGVGYLPGTPGSPYRREPVPDGVVAERLRALWRLCDGVTSALVVPVESLQLMVPTVDRLRAHTRRLAAGGRMDPDHLGRLLAVAGYERVSTVGQAGEFSRRGGIVDVYPVGEDSPVRVEFDGEEIVSLRSFDPLTQRSAGRLGQALILPRSEWLLPVDGDAPPFSGSEERKTALLRELMRKQPRPPGMEWFAPLFGWALVGFEELLGADPVLWVEDPEQVAAKAQQTDARLRDARSSAAEGGLPLVPLELFHREWSWVAGWLSRSRGVDVLPGMQGEYDVEFDAQPQESFGGNLRLLKPSLSRTRVGPRTHLLCETDGQMRRLQEIVGHGGNNVVWGVGRLKYGFVSEELGVSLLTASEVFDRGRRRRRVRRYGSGIPLRDCSAVHVGDYVVHSEHGIARYGGLHRLEVDGRMTDCLILRYAGEDRLYVPIDHIGLVERYQGDGSRPPVIHRLGGSEWRRAKRKAQKAAAELAAELLRLQAVRSASPGHAYSPDGLWQQELEPAFGYLVTSDQKAATDEIKRDMESQRPMDRLICGDVGYGKTELAVRAAFKAVTDSRQVALLVPTTLLARQHLETFRHRFAEFPIRVELLSRLRGRGAQKGVLEGLRRGTVDVVIGTHRLLSREVKFKDLGLIIIDEEHRFGVAQKERLKKCNEVADVLSLTATPIPRTLHLSLIGARDMTMVATPPAGRKPIKTRITEFDEETIAHAIRQELDRGGQVFFVHNRVQSIRAMAGLLSSLVPEASIGVAHGQMAPRELETVMQRFLDREFDVLVTTMIIGSGMDVPSTNTLIVSRADRLGLAQLYQLRGRVGRSDEQAYAYLLIPPRTRLGDAARKRLEALREFSRLGSGFGLALRDLQIRGMGNLLGPEQHGHMVSVGFEMYCRLLREAVSEVRGEAVATPAVARVRSTLDAFLPQDYAPDESMKFEVYRTLAAAETVEDVREVTEELRDRCGPPPGPARALLWIAEVRVIASEMGVQEVDIGPDEVAIRFGSDATRWLSSLAGVHPTPRKVTPADDGGLRLTFSLQPGEEPAAEAAKLLRLLAPVLRPPEAESRLGFRLGEHSSSERRASSPEGERDGAEGLESRGSGGAGLKNDD